MSLRQVAGMLSRLSVAAARLTPPSSNFITSFRQLSTSAVLCRNLDSHAIPPYMYPSSKNKRWVERKPIHEMYEYTIKPIPNPKDGGRGPNGRIWNHRRGGGLKHDYLMIDWVRNNGAKGETLIEKVDSVLEDPNRSARIALVANGEHKRYIIATDNMKAGDLIQSSLVLTRSPVRPVAGNSYPLGSLPIGTVVCCVERFPGTGGTIASNAGTTALLLRKRDDTVCVRMPSKREIIVSAMCQATVGRVSNPDHNKQIIGKAGRNRWLGIRPRSGRWHRKTGKHGRKAHPIPPTIEYFAEGVLPVPPRPIPFTYGSVPCLSNHRTF